MTILIVDDQISVVSALMFGINWDKFGKCRVLKAYNAFEAREQLLKYKVDILLCDIEMPVENGLSLFKWIREQGMDTECIFLTAHADFMYAKEAIRLGSFDYILQPARYEDIENSIFRSMEKINIKRKSEQINSFGELVLQKKDMILNGIMKEWLEGQDAFSDKIRLNLKRLGINLVEEKPSLLIYCQIEQTQELMKEWSDELLKYAMQNIIKELFSYYGQNVLVYQKEREEYFIYIYRMEEANEMEKVKAANQLKRFVELVYDFYRANLICYFLECENIDKVKENAKKLLLLKDQQITVGGMVYDADTFSMEKVTSDFRFTDIFPHMEEMIQNDLYDAVCDEVIEFLNKKADNKRISREFLERFYQEFMGIVYLAAEKNHISVNQIFESNKELKRALNAYSSIEEMNWLIRSVNGYFNECSSTKEKQKSQIDQILLYIRSNLDEDIKRSDIAEFVHLNPNYVSRLFKSEVGISLKEYIMKEKMKLARQMIKSTNLRISMVAMKVGYTNFSHFTQVYKKMFNGMTPAEDRELALKEKEDKE